MPCSLCSRHCTVCGTPSSSSDSSFQKPGFGARKRLARIKLTEPWGGTNPASREKDIGKSMAAVEVLPLANSPLPPTARAASDPIWHRISHPSSRQSASKAAAASTDRSSSCSGELSQSKRPRWALARWGRVAALMTVRPSQQLVSSTNASARACDLLLHQSILPTPLGESRGWRAALGGSLWEKVQWASRCWPDLCVLRGAGFRETCVETSF